MKTVEIDSVSLTEEQVMQAYEKLQEPEFEYPMWFKRRDTRTTLILRFDALLDATVVVSERGVSAGKHYGDAIPHTNEKVWQQVDEPELYERCKEGYFVSGTGRVIESKSPEVTHYNNFNLYPTLELAVKAAKLMHESNKLIMACLLEDPDYEPDWNDTREQKHSIYFDTVTGEYNVGFASRYKGYAAYVSSAEKAKEVAKLMNDWRESHE